MDTIEYYEAHFDGYLSAISRLSETKIGYSCSIIKMDHGIDVAIGNMLDRWNMDAKLVSKTKLDYQESENVLKDDFYCYLTNLDQPRLDLIDWDIQEYFGLLSTSLNENGIFHPMVRNGGYKLNIDTGGYYKKNTSLLVVVESFAVVLTVTV